MHIRLLIKRRNDTFLLLCVCLSLSKNGPLVSHCSASKNLQLNNVNPLLLPFALYAHLAIWIVW